MVQITNNAFTLFFNVTFHLGPLDVLATGFAGIYNDSSPGLALDLNVSIDFDILNGIFHISAAGSLELNTTNLTRTVNSLSVGPNLFRLMLTGKVDIAKYYSNDYIDMANNFDETKIRDQAKNYKVS